MYQVSFCGKHMTEQLQATHLKLREFTYDVFSFDLITAWALWFFVPAWGSVQGTFLLLSSKGLVLI